MLSRDEWGGMAVRPPPLTPIPPHSQFPASHSPFPRPNSAHSLRTLPHPVSPKTFLQTHNKYVFMRDIGLAGQV